MRATQVKQLKTKKPKEPRSVRLDPDEYEQVKELSKQYGVKPADWMRRAVLKWRPAKEDLE